MSERDPVVARLEAIAGAIAIPGLPSWAVRYGNGHINDTLLAEWSTPEGPQRFIHQRLNQRVFPDLQAVMGNVALVCAHLAAQGGDPRRRLELVPAWTGTPQVIDAEGRWWRTYRFVEDSVTRERVESPAEAEAAARAFGGFLRQLEGLPGQRLRETIPDFHHTPRRLEQLERARQADPLARARDCAEELAFVAARAAQAGVVVDGLAAGRLPLRTTHNDTKLNNVLLDAASGEGLCVIDLDTLMPGSALYDIGDLLRTTCSTGAEDEPRPETIDCDLAVYQAVIRGFAESLGERLVAAERALLPLAGPLITFECGVRFLADHLAGDRYFRIRHPGHNLQRARAQFALVAAFERHAEAIAGICADAGASA